MKSLSPKFQRIAIAVLIVVALGLVAFGPMATPEAFKPFNGRVLTASANSAPMAWRANGDIDGADVFYKIVQGTDVNTVSLKLQVSPDGQTWVDGSTIATDVATDTTSFTTTVTVAGLYSRMVATVAGTDPVTVTGWVVTH